MPKEKEVQFKDGLRLQVLIDIVSGLLLWIHSWGVEWGKTKKTLQSIVFILWFNVIKRDVEQGAREAMAPFFHKLCKSAPYKSKMPLLNP